LIASVRSSNVVALLVYGHSDESSSTVTNCSCRSTAVSLEDDVAADPRTSTTSTRANAPSAISVRRSMVGHLRRYVFELTS